jgi:hypothetical protein
MYTLLNNRICAYFSLLNNLLYVNCYKLMGQFYFRGNQSTRRKPLTCRKPLTNYHIMFFRIHLTMRGIRTHVSGDWH